MNSVVDTSALCFRWRSVCTPVGVPAISRVVERSDTPDSGSKMTLHPGGVPAPIAVAVHLSRDGQRSINTNVIAATPPGSNGRPALARCAVVLAARSGDVSNFL